MPLCHVTLDLQQDHLEGPPTGASPLTLTSFIASAAALRPLGPRAGYCGLGVLRVAAGPLVTPASRGLSANAPRGCLACVPSPRPDRPVRGQSPCCHQIPTATACSPQQRPSLTQAKAHKTVIPKIDAFFVGSPSPPPIRYRGLVPPPPPPPPPRSRRPGGPESRQRCCPDGPRRRFHTVGGIDHPLVSCPLTSRRGCGVSVAKCHDDQLSRRRCPDRSTSPLRRGQRVPTPRQECSRAIAVTVCWRAPDLPVHVPPALDPGNALKPLCAYKLHNPPSAPCRCPKP